MKFIENLKAAAIRATDFLNEHHDPFPPFDRPAIPKELKTLHALELEFFQDLNDNFWGCEDQVVLHRIPLPEGSPLDMGDQGIWHGVYTFMLSLRWHLRQDQETEHAVRKAVRGLKLHQTIHGEPHRRLIRGVSNDLSRWEDNASNDTATGHLLGIYGVWKFGPPELRAACLDLISEWGWNVIGNDYSLLNANGRPTTYGSLIQGIKTDSLRLTLALAICKVGYAITGNQPFQDAYRDLYDKYKPIIPYPKVRLWWINNQNDTHRAAIHLAILADLSPENPIYEGGLQRLRKMVAKEGNIWVNALCAWGICLPEFNDQQLALKVLSEFTLEDKQFNNGIDNSVDGTLELTSNGVGYQFKRILWNGTWMANQPLPRWAVRSQDFFWQRNLRSLDVGSSGAQADSRLNGGDFLAAYWLSRLTGAISKRD